MRTDRHPLPNPEKMLEPVNEPDNNQSQLKVRSLNESEHDTEILGYVLFQMMFHFKEGGTPRFPLNIEATFKNIL